MVNNQNQVDARVDLGSAQTVAGAYAAVSIATLAALVVLSVLSPRLATPEAWGHAVIVAVLALLLPLRLRAARRGSVRALRAARIIAVVILVVNVVEAALPGVFPGWLRVDMGVVAALMLLLVIVLARVRR